MKRFILALRPVALTEIIIHPTQLPQEDRPTRFLMKLFLEFIILGQWSQMAYVVCTQILPSELRNLFPPVARRVDSKSFQLHRASLPKARLLPRGSPPPFTGWGHKRPRPLRNPSEIVWVPCVTTSQFNSSLCWILFPSHRGADP